MLVSRGADARPGKAGGTAPRPSRHAPGVADHAHRGRVSRADERDYVTAVGGTRALRGQPLRQRLTSGDGLQAADVPAAADDVLGRCADVADVARGSTCTVMY